MNIIFFLLFSCFSVNHNGKIKHEHDIDVKIKFIDDTGDTGGTYEPILK